SALEQQRRALNLTVVVTLAEIAQRHPSLAEFFFGLVGDSRQRLCEWPLAAYPLLAEAPQLLVCAFGDVPALWSAWAAGLKGRSRPPDLVLPAMQPGFPPLADASVPLRRYASA